MFKGRGSCTLTLVTSSVLSARRDFGFNRAPHPTPRPPHLLQRQSYVFPPSWMEAKDSQLLQCAGH